MSEIQNSALLDSIMQRAARLTEENGCSGLTRDFIIIAAIAVLDEQEASGSRSDEEYLRTKELLSGFSRDAALISSVLEAWNHKDIPYTEKMILSTKRGKSLNTAKLTEKTQLTADIYLSEILQDNTLAVKSLRKDQPAAQEAPPAWVSALSSPREQNPEQEKSPDSGKEDDGPNQSEAAGNGGETAPSMSGIIQTARKLQNELQKTVMGQQHAISVFVSGFFQAELQMNIDPDRKRPRATFLFAGPPGVGKTFLAEEAARSLGLPFMRFDMSEYSDPASPQKFIGTDQNYKASSEGLLTKFVSKNPRCVLLFDEIEKAHMDVILLFLQLLDAGRLHDSRTGKEISFKNAIIIFTTNVGKDLYDQGQDRNLSTVSRDVILEALSSDINPRTKEPYFPPAICSRFASGNVIMFNHLDAYSLRAIIVRELERHIGNIGNSMGISVHMDENVPTALLLAEGALADARSVKSRADAFFNGELYELFRLLSTETNEKYIDTVKNISISVNLAGEEQSIQKLFTPTERIHALAFTQEPLPISQDDSRMPVIHYVKTFEQAKKTIARENIQLVFCDMFGEEKEDARRFLNIEDRESPARDFLKEMLIRFPRLSVVLTEPAGCGFSDEEKLSYLRKGISGFLSLEPDGLADRMARYTESIFQQNSMTEMARSNQLIRYETSQSILDGGSAADIVLFDMRTDRCVKAGDSENVLSLLSTPDVKFDDVIGAEDAKSELRFFVSYMQQPKKYRVSGLSAPKGVLLYGPPGTGKTMLAKAFAAESHATFIATEGNQFFKQYIGQGPAMVHRLFATARRYAPAVLFIDEIDVIARARSGRDTDMGQDSEAILTALFAEMDGFTENDKPVFVLGATNYSVEPGARMSLDPAMLRRFDRRILIDLPNLENRKKYLAGQLKKRSVFRVSQEDADNLADRSTGMSLAQLSSILDLAIRKAMQNQQETVDGKMLEEAFETFNSGEAKNWDADTTLRTARHESGHALISWLSGEKPSFVTIVSRSSYGGYMQYADQEKRMGYTRQELLARIRTALGGRAAEIVCYGEEDGLSTGASGDLKTATSLAERMICQYGMDEQFGLAVIDHAEDAVLSQLHAQVNQILTDQLSQAVRQIRDNKEKLDAMVSRLLASNTLKTGEIDSIMEAPAE